MAILVAGVVDVASNFEQRLGEGLQVGDDDLYAGRMELYICH